jgi:hypothetical protein
MRAAIGPRDARAAAAVTPPAFAPAAATIAERASLRVAVRRKEIPTAAGII